MNMNKKKKVGIGIGIGIIGTIITLTIAYIASKKKKEAKGLAKDDKEVDIASQKAEPTDDSDYESTDGLLLADD